MIAIISLPFYTTQIELPGTEEKIKISASYIDLAEVFSITQISELPHYICPVPVYHIVEFNPFQLTRPDP